MQLKHVLAVIGLGLLSPYALAGSVADTTICTPVKQAFQGAALNLPKGQQPIYGIYNPGSPGTKPIQLRSVNKTGTAQAGWGSQLQGGHWSALTLSNKPLTLLCAQGGKTVACSTVVTVCQFRQATFMTDKPQGSYWVAEDIPASDIIDAMAKRDIDADG